MKIVKQNNQPNFCQKPIINQQQKKKKESDTIKGVLLNNYIQKQSAKGESSDFDSICNTLLVPENSIPTQQLKDESGFDYKKALKPFAILTLTAIASAVAVSALLRGYSGKISKQEGIVCPPDLARNINILEEPHFTLYRALREPTGRNIFGFIGVCIMSGITLASKNLIDGIKEVWIKKQKCDIEHDFQKDMIDVETKAFSGKLDVVNNMLKNTSDYFKRTLKDDNKGVFKGFLNFKGDKKEKSPKEEKKDNRLRNIALIISGAVGLVGVGYLAFRNYQKTAKNLNTFVAKYQDAEIKSKIQNAIQKNDKDSAIKELSNVLKVINATEDTMQSNLSQIQGITPDEIAKAIKEVKASQIYAKAPEALGGISEKIQYYCYINEERGHLYNWILNPENPFNKYLFLGFSTISSLGYIAHTVADAIKEVAVTKENTKSELKLKKDLVAVEIENFKAKKESAINPLIANFDLQMKNGKPKEELKEVAQNILVEIKNGPPYVYS